MATATKQARAPRQGGHANGAPGAFRVFQSNSGEYRWEIVAKGGAMLAQSCSFASSADAERAAVRVRDGAASIRIDFPSPPDKLPAPGRAARPAGAKAR